MKSLFVVLAVVAAVNGEGLNCTPNSNFKMACNSCVCSQDGKSAACTDMACPDWEQEVTEEKQVCEPRTQFKDYCNTCWCDADGLSFSCTRMACDPSIWNKDGSLKFDRHHQAIQSRSAPRKVCKPRSHFNEYCNTCACADDGQSYACTRMACDPEIWNEDGSVKIELPEKPKVVAPKQVCKPRSQFKKYCNTCFCDVDGSSAACTRMYCDRRVWNEDGSLKIANRIAPVRESVYDKQCEPGKPFKYYCNTCSCSASGTVGGCTRMACNEDLWNEDGSRKIGDQDQTCEPGKAYSPDGCNTCICNEDGTRSLCTLKGCVSNLIQTYSDKDMKKWGPLYQSGDRCTPGESFYSQCNQCVCSNDGQNAFCTLKRCSFQQ